MRFLNYLARNGRRKNVQFAMILPPCPSSMLILKRGSSRSALENVKKGGPDLAVFRRRYRVLIDFERGPEFGRSCEIGFWPDFGRRIPPPPSMPPHLPTLAHPPTC